MLSMYHDALHIPTHCKLNIWLLEVEAAPCLPLPLVTLGKTTEAPQPLPQKRALAICCHVAFTWSRNWGLPALKPKLSSALSLQDIVAWAGSSFDVFISKCLLFLPSPVPLPSFFGFLSVATQFLTPVSSWSFWKQIEASSFLRGVMHCTSQLPFLSCSLLLHARAHTPTSCVHTHLDRWRCSEELLQFLIFSITHGWSAKCFNAATAP